MARVERRRPDRHLVALRLLKGIAGTALVVSFALWVVPPVLTEFGVIGPTPEEAVQNADRAIKVARTYGAANLPDFQKAEHERDRASELARAGQGREARKVADKATEYAIEAQKQALVRRSDVQQKAFVAYNDLDKQINDLEKLYGTVTPGMEKAEVGELLTLMKVTRQSAGTVFLAYEKQDWNAVLGAEAHARDVIAGTRKTLESAKRR